MRISCLLQNWLESSAECARYIHSWNQKCFGCRQSLGVTDYFPPSVIIITNKVPVDHEGFMYLSNYQQPLLALFSPQRSAVLEHILNQDDTWPIPLCRAFILQWASILESKVVIRITHPRAEERTQTEYDVTYLCHTQKIEWRMISLLMCAEEAHADRWLAWGGWEQTAWTE